MMTHAQHNASGCVLCQWLQPRPAQRAGRLGRYFRSVRWFCTDAGRYRLHIVGEVTVDVRHCLMALPGVKKEDLRRVQSHPQALSQCDNYLRNMKGVVREAVSDTAGAAQAIAQQGIRFVCSQNHILSQSIRATVSARQPRNASSQAHKLLMHSLNLLALSARNCHA